MQLILVIMHKGEYPKRQYIMSERQPTPLPSPEQLFSRLTSLAYKHDYQFERGHTDAMDIERKVRIFAGQVEVELDETQVAVDAIENETPIMVPIYNEQIIRFSAERPYSSLKERLPIDPAGFSIQQEFIKQVNHVPNSILHRVEPEVAECYEMGEPGDLNVLSFVHYSVLREDDDITINRNIGYKLRDIDEVIYESSELVGQPIPQPITIAHHPDPLLYFEPIKEEKVEDQIEQLFYNEQFSLLFDGVVNMEYYLALHNIRDADAITSILGLAKCLNQRRPLPKRLLL